MSSGITACTPLPEQLQCTLDDASTPPGPPADGPPNDTTDVTDNGDASTNDVTEIGDASSEEVMP